MYIYVYISTLLILIINFPMFWLKSPCFPGGASSGSPPLKELCVVISASASSVSLDTVLRFGRGRAWSVGISGLYIDMHKYVYIYIYICIYIYMHVIACDCMYTYNMYIYVYIYIYLYIYIWNHIHMYVYIYIWTYILYRYTYLHTSSTI